METNKTNATNVIMHSLRHFLSHIGEESNKLNQKAFASSYLSSPRIHLQTHRREEPNKCNECDFAFSGRQFEDTFESSQCRKAKEMQSMKMFRKPTNTNLNLVRPGTLLKQVFQFVEAPWFKQCTLVKPMHLGFQRLLA